MDGAGLPAAVVFLGLAPCSANALVHGVAKSKQVLVSGRDEESWPPPP